MRLPACLIVSAAAACVSIPPFISNKVVGRFEDLGYSIDALTEGGARYHLHFAGIVNYCQLPDSLVVDGREVLGSDSHAQMHLQGQIESQIGIAEFPDFRASADSSDLDRNSIDSILSALVEGPAAVQVSVTCALHTTTIAGSGSPSITSIFTAYPRGKIFRYDSVTAHLPTPTSATFLTSYVTLDPQFSYFDTAAGSDRIVGTGRELNEPAVCAHEMSAGARIGIGWPVPARSRVHATTNMSAAYVFDWIRQGEMLGNETQYTEMSLIHVSDASEGAAGCDLTQLSAAFSQRLHFMQDGSAAPVVRDSSGAYAFTSMSSSPITVTFPDGVDQGFAIALTAFSVSDVTVTGDVPADPEPYIVQKSGESTFWIWFNFHLTSGQTLTLTPHA